MSGEWAKPRTYIRVDEKWGTLCARCGNCGEITGWKDVYDCPYCNVHFTQITSPFERDIEYCRRVRPDLEYVVLPWA